MIRHEKIARHPRTFKTLTGLSTEGFIQILPSFEEAWESDLDRRDTGRVRRRRRGGGRKGRLADTADRLVFILMYFRLYPVQAVQGLLFGKSQPQANEWVHRLAPVLNAVPGYLTPPQPRQGFLKREKGKKYLVFRSNAGRDDLVCKHPSASTFDNHLQ